MKNGRPMMTFRSAILAAAAATLLATACTPAENWEDPKWLAHAMKHNHPKVFSEYLSLDEETRLALLPNVIDAYNSNQQQKGALRALLSVKDERTIEVYRNALARPDDELALLGARGLVQMGDTASGAAIADRLGTVTTPGTFLGFVEALEPFSSPEAIEAIAVVAQRPADRIGGVATVQGACRIMEKAPNASEDIVRGITFGLVNFRAQPYEDAVRECEMAALVHKTAVLPALVELYKGDNERANDLVKGLGFSDATARMRAAMVMGHARDHKANNAIRTWLRTEQVVPRSELAAMNLNEQQNWYDNHGQLFEISVKALAYERNSEDRELLRSLVDPAGELRNFRAWFSLSEGAEMGLRQAAATALVSVADASSKAFLWNEARTGDIARGNEQTDTLYHLNVIHALGRIATKGDLASFRTAVNAQPERWRHEFRGLLGYFVLGEVCGDDVACRQQYVLDPTPLLERKDVRDWVAAETEARRPALEESLKSAVQAGGVWQIAHLGGDAAASDMLTSLMRKGPEVAQTAIPEALLYCRAWSPTVSQELEAWLEETGQRPSVPGWGELRHLVRVVAYLSKV